MGKSKTTRGKASPVEMAQNAPEFAEVLGEIIRELHNAEDVAMTICEALKGINLTESHCAETTLRLGCVSTLNAQIDRLEKAIASARLRVRDDRAVLLVMPDHEARP